jgi:hypothetical protein
MASLDIFRLVVALATILMGFALLKWREQMIDSSWEWLIPSALVTPSEQ